MSSLFGGNSQSNQSQNNVSNINPIFQFGNDNKTKSDLEGTISSATNPTQKDSMELSASAVVPVNSKTGNNKASSEFKKEASSIADVKNFSNDIPNVNPFSSPMSASSIIPDFSSSNNNKYIYAAGFVFASFLAFYIFKKK